MEELLVLGQIPFTDIRISFDGWLTIMVILLLVFFAVNFIHAKSAAIRAYILSQKVSRLLTHHHLM